MSGPPSHPQNEPKEGRGNMAQIAQERIVVSSPSGYGMALLAIPGDEIPDEVAAFYGITDGRMPKASSKKISAVEVEDKAIKPATKKTAPKE